MMRGREPMAMSTTSQMSYVFLPPLPVFPHPHLHHFFSPLSPFFWGILSPGSDRALVSDAYLQQVLVSDAFLLQVVL